MSAASDELYRSLSQSFLTTKDNWDPVNQTLKGGQQLESVVNEMATVNFKGYRRFIFFTIGTEHYKAQLLPPQNKATREKRSYYHSSNSQAQSYANLMIYERRRGGTNMLNLHILLRTLAAEEKWRKFAEKHTPNDDGWTTV